MQQSSKLLITNEYFFPATGGGPVKSLKLICDALCDQFGILVSCSSKDLDNSDLQVLTNIKHQYKDTSYQVVYNNSWKSAIQKYSDANVIYINGIYSLIYNIYPILFHHRKVVLAVRGMVSVQALNQKALKKKIFLTFIRPILSLFPVVFHATSEEEVVDIKREMGSRSKVKLIANLPSILPFHASVAKSAGSIEIGTLSLISPMKNHLEVLRALKSVSGNVIYHIWGPVKEPEYWNECLKAVSELPDNISVQYHGSIGEQQVAAALSKCHLIVQPSESENFGHSLVEALSLGRPVLTSHNTPWNQLIENYAGRNVEPLPAEINAALQMFIDLDQLEFDKFVIGSHAYIGSRLNIDQIKEDYINLFKSLL